MRFNMRYEDTDKLEVFLGKLETDCSIAGETIRREGAKIIKTKVIGELNRLRSKTNKLDYTHMADDVRISTRKDQYGDSVTRIQGGRKTGTKWHLVNDGTYKTNATHFMDRAINESEAELQSVIDSELSRVGD